MSSARLRNAPARIAGRLERSSPPLMKRIAPDTGLKTSKWSAARFRVHPPNRQLVWKPLKNMIDSAYSALFWGAVFGIFNGAVSRYALKKAMHRSDKAFYSVFVAGFFWRFVFLIAAVWFLRDKKYIILLPFAGALILTQVIFEVVPLKKNGS